jgi:hypothetical protein
MSNLSKRVQKSKSLKFNKIPSVINGKIGYGTTSHNCEHSYQVYLAKARETSQFGDKEISHDTITVNCIQTHQPVGDCPGNSNNAICYHGLGAIRHHLAGKGAIITFCENIFDAIKLRKPGRSLVKIISGQGQAVLWGVVGQKAEDKLAANVLAMRLSKEEAEGID